MRLASMLTDGKRAALPEGNNNKLKLIGAADRGAQVQSLAAPAALLPLLLSEGEPPSKKSKKADTKAAAAAAAAASAAAAKADRGERVPHPVSRFGGWGGGMGWVGEVRRGWGVCGVCVCVVGGGGAGGGGEWKVT